MIFPGLIDSEQHTKPQSDLITLCSDVASKTFCVYRRGGWGSGSIAFNASLLPENGLRSGHQLSSSIVLSQRHRGATKEKNRKHGKIKAVPSAS